MPVILCPRSAGVRVESAAAPRQVNGPALSGHAAPGNDGIAALPFSGILLLILWCLIGCAPKTTVESRKQEHWTAYQAMAPEQRELVDQGQIRVGMTREAVYIAWGPPSETLESETETGYAQIWIYHGQTVEETRYWTFREVPRGGTVFLERTLESDYYPRRFIRAEIHFTNGIVSRWRTLPTPG